MDLSIWAAKFFGAVVGVLISMVMVAPKSTANGLYRILLAPVAGVIFAPGVQGIFWFLQGSTLEHYMAASCFAGFSAWFVLEFTARMLSSDEWLTRLLEEVLRLKGKGPTDKAPPSA
ncbi:hypothetical protein SAMN05216456_1334 [Devosia crocina]|uniref:Uncharacterized protein n=1 Tax=Devosia crocina TaxID=429728 RepID=A0A1I7N9R8_9HYPH|nr:DUF6107 family protein [Devosia crocina]SFV31417.1 hypothetical protein SAMN05216456_1334 [Devosia crocina]